MDASDEPYKLINRLAALLNTLQRGPATARQIGAALRQRTHATRESDQRRIKRDIRALQRLGFQIEEHSKPIIFTFRGYPSPAFSPDELQTLALIREAFADFAPHDEAVQQLLERLTGSLTEAQRRIYDRRPVLRFPLRTAINYHPYRKLIHWLEQAIIQRHQIAFDYQPLASASPVRHDRLDPYEIEYFHNHFYLLAYSYRSQFVQEFRIDRIIKSERSPERLPSLAQPMRRRKPITFTYRLPARFVEHGVSERFNILDFQIKTEQDGEWAYIQAQWWSEFWIVRTLLAYAENVVIIEPASLKEKYVKTLQRMLAAAAQESPAEIMLPKTTSDI